MGVIFTPPRPRPTPCALYTFRSPPPQNTHTTSPSPASSPTSALLNILLLSSDLFAAIFDVMTNGVKLTTYFYVAFACIVIGIVLYEAGPSPADQDHAGGAGGGTPSAIEFHSRERRAAGNTAAPAAVVVLSSSSTTEHAGNLSKDDDAEFT